MAEDRDLAAGVPLEDVPRDGVLGGVVGDDPVMLARVPDDHRPGEAGPGRHGTGGLGTGERVVAWDAKCTHVGASLPTGLRVGTQVHCPFHHACFSLRTGEALLAPAFAPLRGWEVVVADGLVRVLPHAPAPAPADTVDDVRGVRRVVVAGGGAAGYGAVERLRRAGWDGELTLVSAEPHLPVDRTKLSKGYLGGQAGADGLPMTPASWYGDHDVTTLLGTGVDRIDLAEHLVSAGGRELPWDALVLATGAEPVRPGLPGFDGPGVHVLRSVADADGIIAAAGRAGGSGGRVVVLGSGFIGLETAAAMRDRGVDVTVVGLDEVPLAGVVGAELGELVRRVHEEHGVRFAVGKAAGWDGSALRLEDGTRVEGSALVLGLGVRPRTALAEAAGLAVDDGILVDAYGETAHAGVFAAGDVARFPDARTGAPIRVEHWAVAGRAGAWAAVNALGGEQAMTEPPYFWSKHYDLNIRFAGHVGPVAHGPTGSGGSGGSGGGAEATVEGSLADRSATIRYREGGRLAAVATVGRDDECLVVEDELRQDTPA